MRHLKLWLWMTASAVSTLARAAWCIPFICWEEWRDRNKIKPGGD